MQLIEEDTESLASDFIQARNTTLELFQPLKIEDAVMQSDNFGSPPNWHLAHVTWFFHKVLERHGEKLDNKQDGINLAYLNSYYQRYGQILQKSERGKFPRPTVEQTLKYRSIIDKAVLSFLNRKLVMQKEGLSNDACYDLMLGIQHEMQHQELMIYDFQHYFQRFPDSEDNYKPVKRIHRHPTKGEKLFGMTEIPGGIYELGSNGRSFCYDNELPEHKVYLQSFKIDVAPITNGDFMRFIEAGGYQDYKYWLADGWDLIQEQGWNAPLYWERKGDRWLKKDFRGLCEIDLDEPVTNVSYYEADVYAR